jgi:hypothetical protein
MNERADNQDDDEPAQEAAEHAERAADERQEMTRKANLAGAADDGGEADRLARESEDHREAAYEQEVASSERAQDAD